MASTGGDQGMAGTPRTQAKVTGAVTRITPPWKLFAKYQRPKMAWLRASHGNSTVILAINTQAANVRPEPCESCGTARRPIGGIFARFIRKLLRRCASKVAEAQIAPKASALGLTSAHNPHSAPHSNAV